MHRNEAIESTNRVVSLNALACVFLSLTKSTLDSKPPIKEINRQVNMTGTVAKAVISYQFVPGFICDRSHLSSHVFFLGSCPALTVFSTFSVLPSSTIV